MVRGGDSAGAAQKVEDGWMRLQVSDGNMVRGSRCPECGAPMVIRRNRNTDGEFLGCSRFPDCTETRALPEDVKLRREGAQVLPGFEL